MARFIVCVLCVVGASALLSHFFPSLTHVAFVVAGFGITWMMLIGMGVGFAAYKVTK